MAGRRELGRDRRRAQVLGAARKLIASGGVEALTMRALAREAGVAVNTVYALFGGSRDDVLAALIEAGIDDLDRMLHEKEVDDPLALGPTLAEIVVDTICEHEALYRAVFLAQAHRDRGDPVIGHPRALEIARGALGTAVAAGLLRDDLDLDLLNEQVFQAFRYWALRWATRDVDGAELRLRLLYASHLPLVAAATDETREPLLAALRSTERALRRHLRRKESKR